MANHVAVRLDHMREADMSCIAGVGGDVKPLVRTARSGRRIVVLDGCPLRCAAHILARHGIAPDVSIDLSRMGVKKNLHQDFDPDQARQVLEEVRLDLRTLH